MTDPAMPTDLDRLLSAASVPTMPAGLIDRIVAEATRPDRVALPAPSSPRRRSRWARRGVRSGIVAVSLMLATAVAAAFGGGGLTFTRIAAVAQHVVQHIRHPFRHAAPAAPACAPVVHRMAVPRSLIGVAPHGGAPMAMPRPLAIAPPMVRPLTLRREPVRMAPRSGPPTHIDRRRLGERAAPRSPARLTQRPFVHDRGDGPARKRADRPFRAEPRAPIATPRSDPEPAAITQPAARDGGLARDGGARFDGPRWRNPDGMAGAMRGPGWRRRMRDGGGDAPGWRRRGNMGGGGAGRPRPFRPGGGRRPRRF